MGQNIVFVACLVLPCVLGSANIHSEAVEKLVESNTAFAVDLYHQIVQQSGVTNVVFSPVSVSAALAMLKIGTNGDSSVEIEKALHLEGIESSLVNSAFGELNGLLFDKPKSNITLTGANGAFVSKKSTVLKDYRNALSVFGASIEELDFSDSKASVSHINNWISEKTGDLIKDMLPDDAIKATTAMLLTSTLYFSGKWHSGFAPVQTEHRGFYISHYRIIKTPFMYQRGKFRFGYVESLSLQVLEMPYAGQEISMIVLLPDNFDLQNIEKNLNHKNLTDWLANLKYESVDLTLPKFKIDTGIELQKSLQGLGVSDIFTSGKADLSGITGDKTLYVDEIMHKGVLEVEPLGGLVRAEREEANRAPRTDRVTFYADHPFIFVIKSMKTDVIYLFGALKRPEGEEMHHDEL